MKNRLSKILCVMLSCLCLFSVFSLSACQKDPDPYNLAGKWENCVEFIVENGELYYRISETKKDKVIKYEVDEKGNVDIYFESGGLPWTYFPKDDKIYTNHYIYRITE